MYNSAPKSGYEKRWEEEKGQSEAAMQAGMRDIYGMSKFERESSKSTVGCFGVVFGIAAVALFVVSYSLFSFRARMDREGVDTTAFITKTVRSRRSFTAIYEYEVDGQTYKGNSSSVGRVLPGETLPIRYLPSDPNKSEAKGTANILLCWVPVIAGLIMAIVAGDCFRKIKKLGEPEPDMFGDLRAGREAMTAPAPATASIARPQVSTNTDVMPGG